MRMKLFGRLFTGKRAVAVLLVMVLILSLGVTGVYSAVRAVTGSVENSLSADTEGSVSVTKDYTVKVSDIKYAVFVRVDVVATWQNEAGNVLAITPEMGTDYTLTLNSSKWFTTSDGYYYYAEPLKDGDSTTPLIAACEPLKAAPKDGYTLSVKLMAQSVQALGTTDEDEVSAAENAWNTVMVSDGKLIAK